MIMLRLKNVHVIRGCIIPQNKEYHHEQTLTKKTLKLPSDNLFFLTQR